LLSVSLFPCRRSHPARVVRRVSQSATAHAAFAFPVAGSASGAAHLRGHLCVRLRYSLETRPHPIDEAVERLQKVGFPSPCSPSYRALAFPLVGFPPTEHASLRWTHNRTCHFDGIRLNTFDCSPWRHHEASGPISPVPQVSTCVQLTRPLGTFVSLFSKARGLRLQFSSWCTRLSRAPTTTPHPSLAKVIGVSSRVSPFLLSTLLAIPWQASRVHNGGLPQNAVGGVLLNAPSPLWGSPVFLQGSIRLTWSPMRSHPMEEAWVLRCSRDTSQAQWADR